MEVYLETHVGISEVVAMEASFTSISAHDSTFSAIQMEMAPLGLLVSCQESSCAFANSSKSARKGFPINEAPLVESEVFELAMRT